MSDKSPIGENAALGPGVVLAVEGIDDSGFEIQEERGRGGFGIGYRARDLRYDCDVFVKEHFPSEFALRDADGISVRTAGASDDFEHSLNRFIAEGKALAQFRGVDGIITVLQTFRANGTAYMVTSYEPCTLNEYLRNLKRPATESEVLFILIPLLRGLATVHAKHYLHRDIAADNILIRQSDGMPLLIDFGSAHEANSGEIRADAMAVKPKYAPYEFYACDRAQGPWSDLYSIGAVMHKMITGQLPPEATERTRSDSYQPLAARAQPLVKAGTIYTKKLLETVDWMLRVNAPDRPQSAAQVLKALAADEPAPKVGGGSGKKAVLLAVGSAAVIAAVMAFGLLRENGSLLGIGSSRLIEVAVERDAAGDWAGALKTLSIPLARRDGSESAAQTEIERIITQKLQQKPEMTNAGEAIFQTLESLRQAGVAVDALSQQLRRNAETFLERKAKIEAASARWDQGKRSDAVQQLLKLIEDYPESLRAEAVLRDKVAEVLALKRGTLEEVEAALQLLAPIRNASSSLTLWFEELRQEEQMFILLRDARAALSLGQIGQAFSMVLACVKVHNIKPHIVEMALGLLAEIESRFDKITDSEIVSLPLGLETVAPVVSRSGMSTDSFTRVIKKLDEARKELARVEKELESVGEAVGQRKWATALETCQRVASLYPHRQAPAAALDRTFQQALEIFANLDNRVERLDEYRLLIAQTGRVRSAEALASATLGELRLRAEEIHLDQTLNKARFQTVPPSGAELAYIRGLVERLEVEARKRSGVESAKTLLKVAFIHRDVLRDKRNLSLLVELSGDPKTPPTNADRYIVFEARLELLRLIVQDNIPPGDAHQLQGYLRPENVEGVLQNLFRSGFAGTQDLAANLLIYTYRRGAARVQKSLPKAMEIASEHLDRREKVRLWKGQATFWNVLLDNATDFLSIDKNTELLRLLEKGRQRGHPAAELYYIQYSNLLKPRGELESERLNKLLLLELSLERNAASLTKIEGSLVTELKDELERIRTASRIFRGVDSN